MSRVVILGRHGLIGSALAARLSDVSSYPSRDTKIVYDFASVTHPEFEANPHYHIKQQLNRMADLLPFCYEHGAVYVYPSSALVYEKDTAFSRFKKTMEQFASCYSTVTLGLRIFPVYGPGENRTVISQWCRQMANGEAPVVFGDGAQTRDFIYVEDAVDQILSLADKPRYHSQIVDIGSGIRTSFISIVNSINQALGTRIAPQFVCRPSSYSEGIVCEHPMPTKTSVDDGIRLILNREPVNIDIVERPPSAEETAAISSQISRAIMTNCDAMSGSLRRGVRAL